MRITLCYGDLSPSIRRIGQISTSTEKARRELQTSTHAKPCPRQLRANFRIYQALCLRRSWCKAVAEIEMVLPAFDELSVQYVQAERYLSQEEISHSCPTLSISRKLPGDPRA